MPKIAAWLLALGLCMACLGMIIMAFDISSLPKPKPRVVEMPPAGGTA